jgi:hypothetical protein
MSIQRRGVSAILSRGPAAVNERNGKKPRNIPAI